MQVLQLCTLPISQFDNSLIFNSCQNEVPCKWLHQTLNVLEGWGFRVRDPAGARSGRALRRCWPRKATHFLDLAGNAFTGTAVASLLLALFISVPWQSKHEPAGSDDVVVDDAMTSALASAPSSLFA